MHALTKSELTQHIYECLPTLTKQEAQVAVEAILRSVIAALSHGTRVEVKSFGSFNVKYRKAHQGRNPRTGEKVAVPAKFVPYFHASRQLAEKLRNQGLKGSSSTAV